MLRQTRSTASLKKILKSEQRCSTAQLNLTPQYCRLKLAQGHEFIKCNSFNRKHRIVSCPVDLSTVTWKSTKEYKKHEDKGSVSCLELRSVHQDNLHVKLKFDSRTLDFLCQKHAEATEWSNIFCWLLEIVEEKRLENLAGAGCGKSQNGPALSLRGVYKKRVRSSTVSAGILPRPSRSVDGGRGNEKGKSSTVGKTTNVNNSGRNNMDHNMDHNMDLISTRAKSFVNPFGPDHSNNTNTKEQSLRNRLESPNNQYSKTMSNARMSPEIANEMLQLFQSNRHTMYRRISRLMEGNTFTRYKPHQKPKSRFVWCSLLLDSIMYGLDREHKETTKPRGHLSTMELSKIVAGGANGILDHHFSKKEEVSRLAKLTFSIVSPEATLHLSCQTEQQRDEWVLTLRFVMWMLRNNVDGKIEEFYYWYCNRNKVSRQSMVFNVVEMISTNMPSTRKRGSSHSSALVPRSQQAQIAAVVDFRSRVASSIPECKEEEDRSDTDQPNESVHVMDDGEMNRLDASFDGGERGGEGGAEEEGGEGDGEQAIRNNRKPPPPPPPPSLALPVPSTLELNSEEFMHYLTRSNDQTGLNHWNFLKELNETDRAIHSACALVFQTFNVMVQDKNDETFDGKDAHLVRDAMLASNPLAPFLLARKKSKEYLDRKYVEWREKE